MHRSGDWNGKWELKDEFKNRDADLQNPTGIVAPKAEGDDGEDDEEMDDVEGEGEEFEDV